MPNVTIDTSDGAMHAYVSRPEHAGVHGGIIVFQEAFGVNPHIRDIADRFAELGAVAIAPELYHRTATGFEAPYDTEDAWAAIAPHYESLTSRGIAEDARRTYDWLVRQPQIAKVAAIGFCMGGRAAYVANASAPLVAAVSYYGGGIAPDLLDLASEQRSPILMFWGGLDANIPPDQRRAVSDALTAAQKPHEQVLFSQAGHGFFCDRRKSYEPASAAQAWSLTRSFLHIHGVLD
ncbi:MAG TPA: dienelactone hydrolase family protein [Candidatus Baltobacteraceae bacterium]|nr:dienelactone hydrolase family protein [Candidatus Baltobacteraceae bacterium]